MNCVFFRFCHGRPVYKCFFQWSKRFFTYQTLSDVIRVSFTLKDNTLTWYRTKSTLRWGRPSNVCEFDPVNWLTSANHINKKPVSITQKHDNADDTTHINTSGWKNILTGHAFYVLRSTKICSLNSSNFIGALFCKRKFRNFQQRNIFKRKTRQSNAGPHQEIILSLVIWPIGSPVGEFLNRNGIWSSL